MTNESDQNSQNLKNLSKLIGRKCKMQYKIKDKMKNAKN